MAAYQAIVIMLCIFIVGVLYAALYDPIVMIKDDFVGPRADPQVAQTDEALFSLWWILPAAMLGILAIYGITVTQKG